MKQVEGHPGVWRMDGQGVAKVLDMRHQRDERERNTEFIVQYVGTDGVEYAFRIDIGDGPRST